MAQSSADLCFVSLVGSPGAMESAFRARGVCGAKPASAHANATSAVVVTLADGTPGSAGERKPSGERRAGFSIVDTPPLN
jgi:hypothetical protein